MSNPTICGNCGDVKPEGKHHCGPFNVAERPYHEPPEPDCKPGCTCLMCEDRPEDRPIWSGR